MRFRTTTCLEAPNEIVWLSPSTKNAPEGVVADSDEENSNADIVAEEQGEELRGMMVKARKRS